jgi:hypothetical protein
MSYSKCDTHTPTVGSGEIDSHGEVHLEPRLEILDERDLFDKLESDKALRRYLGKNEVLLAQGQNTRVGVLGRLGLLLVIDQLRQI